MITKEQEAKLKALQAETAIERSFRNIAMGAVLGFT